VPSIGGFGGDDELGDGDGDGVPDLNVKFDRQALIAAIKAGTAGGQIAPDANLQVDVYAGGTFLLGSDTVSVKGN
jgi:hypothetical protein